MSSSERPGIEVEAGKAEFPSTETEVLRKAHRNSFHRKAAHFPPICRFAAPAAARGTKVPFPSASRGNSHATLCVQHRLYNGKMQQRHCRGCCRNQVSGHQVVWIAEAHGNGSRALLYKQVGSLEVAFHKTRRIHSLGISTDWLVAMQMLNLVNGAAVRTAARLLRSNPEACALKKSFYKDALLLVQNTPSGGDNGSTRPSGRPG